MKSELNEKGFPLWGWIIVVPVLSGCVWFWWRTYQAAASATAESVGFGSGVFGDAFGAANAAFTGLALLAIGISIYFQRRELAEVKEDRRNTQKSLDLQVQINKTQAADLEVRRQEDAFYTLLGLVAAERKTLDKRKMDTTLITTRDILKKITDDTLQGSKVLVGLASATAVIQPMYALFLSAFKIASTCSQPESKRQMLELMADIFPTDIKYLIILFALRGKINFGTVDGLKLCDEINLSECLNENDRMLYKKIREWILENNI